MRQMMAPRGSVKAAKLVGGLACALAAAGCQTARTGARPAPRVLVGPAQVSVEPRWRSILQPDDVSRLDRLPDAWTQALAAARASRFSRSLAAEGALLRPDAGLPRAQLPPGSYRCRTITIAPAASSRASYRVEQPQFCHVGVEAELLSFTKQTGSRRPGGYLYEAGDARSVFIGASATGRRAVPPPYNSVPGENVAGIVERVGPFRYRLVVPWPRGGGIIEVVELIPAAAQSE